MDFPRLRKACDDARAVRNAALSALHPLDRDSAQYWREASIWMQRTEVVEQEAQRAYLEELLPALMPEGPWKWVTRRATMLLLLPKRVQRSMDYWEFGHELFDHVLFARNAGGAAVIGRPYISNGCQSDALETATRLAKFQIGVWVRRDLSSYVPAGTQLVVAAGQLFSRTDAADFGFTSLTEESLDETAELDDCAKMV